MRPPPNRPSWATRAFGPGTCPQHEERSSDNASSNVMMSKPSSRNACDWVTIGTQCLRKRFADSKPPGSPFAHGRSCPSWQRLGVMNEKFAVVDEVSRSFKSTGSGTIRRLHDGESITEWKYMNGLCFVAY